MVDDEIVCQAVSQMTGIALDKVERREPLVIVGRRRRIIGPKRVPLFERRQAGSVLHGEGVSIQRGTGFVLIPHNPEYQRIFERAIEPAMRANGLDSRKADDLYKPGAILAQVWEHIRAAEVIVADVSDKNPNVIYELGLCYGLRRCPILLVRNWADLPFNLRNLRYIEYEDKAGGAEVLKKKLTAAIEQFLAQVRRPAKDPSTRDDGEL